MAGNVQKLMANKVNASLAKVLTETAQHTAVEVFAGGLSVNGGALDLNSGCTIQLPVGSATLVGNSATLNTIAGIVTTTALTNATTDKVSITITNSNIAAADMVLAWPMNMSAADQAAAVTRIVPGAGSVVLDLRNVGTAAFNGTVKLGYVVFKNG